VVNSELPAKSDYRQSRPSGTLDEAKLVITSFSGRFESAYARTNISERAKLHREQVSKMTKGKRFLSS
jgi:hypothetical protein